MSAACKSGVVAFQLLPSPIDAAADGIELGGGGDGGFPDTEAPHAFFQYFLASPMWFEHVASFWPHRGEPPGGLVQQPVDVTLQPPWTQND